MIRLIIDKLGGGHQDLFLKIDLMPCSLKIADSFYIFDFLETKEVKKPIGASILTNTIIELINYWTERIKSICQGEEKFIPFDFSDQYISGLRIKKVKLGYEVKYVINDHISGYEVSKSNLDQLTEVQKLNFQISEKEEWLISEKSLFDGLKWSKDELRIKKNN